MDWNCTRPLIINFFPNKYVPNNSQLTESVDMEPHIGRGDCKVIFRFLTVQEVGPLNPHVVQGLTVYLMTVAV